MDISVTTPAGQETKTHRDLNLKGTVRSLRAPLTWILAANILIAAIALFIGYPKPNVDDAFYVGPAIDLYQHGTLTNSIAMPRIRPFFYYPPYYFYVLAGWLHLFGLSSASLAAFQAFAVVLFVSSIQILIWPFVRSVLPLLAMPLISFFGFNALGFRPDAICLAACALGILLACSDKPVKRCSGYFLMYAACFIAPAAVSYFTFASLSIFAIRLFALQRRAFVLDLGLFALAGALSLLVFLWMIQGEYSLFLQMFLYRLRDSGSGQTSNASIFLKQLFSYWIGMAVHIPVLLLAAFLLVKAFLKKEIPGLLLFSVGMFYSAMVMNLVVNTSSTATWLNQFMWLALLILMSFSKLSRAMASSLYTVAAMVFALSITHWVIPFCVGPRPPNGYYASMRALVEQTQSERWLVDTVGLRYIFDYNPPPNVENWESQAFYPDPNGKSQGTRLGRPISSNELVGRRSTELHLISLQHIYQCLPEYAPGLPRLQWRSKTFAWAVSNPYTFRVFTMDR